jgi:hypothetical protein
LIQATGGRIVLASAQAATVSLNGGLYEIAVDQGVANGTVANSGTLATGAAAGSIVLSALDAANLVSGVINLEGVQQASRIEVHGGQVVLASDLNAATVAGSSSHVEVHAGAQIQDAVDIAGAGATIDVWGGSYTEGHANVDYFGAPGGQKFGLHVYKDNLLIRGRKPSGAALTGLDDPDMPAVTAQYQTGFGAQHFVSGSGVTVEGLKFRPVSTGTNKTFEVIGNDFTLRNSVIDNSGNATAAAFYISDFAIAGRPEVETFRIENNRFIAGTTPSALVVVASGAGNDTPASDRIFSGNQLIGTPGLSGARGFQIQGELPHVPWQIFTAGAVTVENNSFANFDVPVRTVGLLSQQLDWNSVFNGNTFVGGAALAFEGGTSTARAASVSVAPQDGTTTPNDAPDTRITRSIQASIDRAQPGDTVRALAGTYVQSSTLKVSKGLTLAGAGQGETVIDARGVGSYGLSVSADDVTLSDFTLYGPSAFFASAYGIKVSPGGPASSRLRNFTIRDVTSRGAGKAELDLNGVDGALIERVVADGAPVGNDAGTTQGAGIQLTDSANVTIRDSTTRNNAWGGVALYQANRSYDQQTANITVEGGNTFHEANPLYLQDESASRDFGALALHGFDYAVRNSDAASHNDQYTWLQYTLNGAVDLAVNLATPGQSYVQGWNVSAPTQDFHVGVGNVQGGGTRAMSIQAAIDAASPGDTLNVAAGKYTGDLLLRGNTRLVTSGADIWIDGDIQGAGGNAYALSLNAGAGDVTLLSGGTAANPLGRLEVASGDFTLLGTLWVTGYDIDALGNVALSDHTLRSAGTGVTNAINAAGNVTGSTVAQAGVQIRSSGNVAANVTAQGEVAVAAVNVNGNFAASRAAFEAQNQVNVTVDVPNGVEIQSGGAANVSGSASSVRIDAPSGSVSGDFGQVTNAGSGLIEVNGKPQVGTSIAASADNSRIVPSEVATAATVPGLPARGEEAAPLRRVRPGSAGDALERGEAVELDLSPAEDDE